MNQVLFVRYLRDKNMIKKKDGDAAKMLEQQSIRSTKECAATKTHTTIEREADEDTAAK